MTGPVSAIEVEMNLYRETARVNRFEDPIALKCDAKLASLAKRHIGIPATSVPSERVFSKAGKLISARQSRLKKSNSLWKDFDEEEAETFDSQKNVLGLCHQLK